MKLLNNNNKKFDNNLNNLLELRRKKIKNKSVSVTNIITDIKYTNKFFDRDL